MKTLLAALSLLFLLGACAAEKTEPDASTSTQTPRPEAAPPSTQTTSSEPAESEEATHGVWSGQVKIDAHAGLGTFNYVGAESGDFVPMRFRTDSEAGAKILAACADDDLCEFEGTVRFLDEPPPENASAVGEIVTVERVKKLPPDAR